VAKDQYVDRFTVTAVVFMNVEGRVRDVVDRRVETGGSAVSTFARQPYIWSSDRSRGPCGSC
jgi:hypothetical protein